MSKAMIQSLPYPNLMEVIPQAIFWRPLAYFSTSLHQGEDELDIFQAISFSLDDWTNFDLRKYRGHPPFIAVLYLPASLDNQVNEATDGVIKGMQVPDRAVAWRRGQDFQLGKLHRPKADRLTEKEARLLCLKIASTCPAHQASTERIKSEAHKYVQFSPLDLAPSQTRPRERMWQQIIGNVVSHRDTELGPFKKGYAVRTRDGMRVTEEGLRYLKSVGFSV